MSSTQHTKKIALVDCNSFYVSCERLFNPKIRKNLLLFYRIMMAVLFQDLMKQKH